MSRVPGLGLPRRYSDLTLTTGQPGEPGILASGDEVEVSARLSPGAGKFMGEGEAASCGCRPSGEPADPRDTGESGGYKRRTSLASLNNSRDFAFFFLG